METDANNREKCNVKINDILSWFRDNQANMERILLLDGCCSAEDIKCEENELVACAASKGSHAESFPCTGGLWTQELWSVFNQKETYDLEKLLRDVKDKMKDKGRNQVPSFQSGLTTPITFTKRMFILLYYKNSEVYKW